MSSARTRRLVRVPGSFWFYFSILSNPDPGLKIYLYCDQTLIENF